MPHEKTGQRPSYYKGQVSYERWKALFEFIVSFPHLDKNVIQHGIPTRFNCNANEKSACEKANFMIYFAMHIFYFDI